MLIIFLQRSLAASIGIWKTSLVLDDKIVELEDTATVTSQIWWDDMISCIALAETEILYIIQGGLTMVEKPTNCAHLADRGTYRGHQYLGQANTPQNKRTKSSSNPTADRITIKWGFPEIGDTPKSSIFYREFPYKKHPAIGQQLASVHSKGRAVSPWPT